MEKFILKYLPYQKHKNTNFCRLCRAIKKEPSTILKYGYLLDAKYPAVPKSKLYIQEQCFTLPHTENFLEILTEFHLHKNLICISNMLNSPTISTHWHVHLFDKKHLPPFFVKFWNTESMANPPNRLAKIINEFGIFYLYPYHNLTIQQKTESLQKISKELKSESTRNLFAFTNSYLIFCKLKNVDKRISISSHAIYGYFFTTKKSKYNFMVASEIKNILSTHAI